MSNDPNAGIFPGMAGDKSRWGDCGCWTCVGTTVAAKPFPQNLSMPFVVCPTCGNKRCPKANQHDNECSGSNDTGQPGSRFATAPENPAHRPTSTEEK